MLLLGQLLRSCWASMAPRVGKGPCGSGVGTCYNSNCKSCFSCVAEEMVAFIK